MYKVVLIDDEITVLDGIRKLIDWKKFNAEVVGAFTNGAEGIRGIERLQPDIVITDFKMPVVNGLDVIQRTKDENNAREYIILSGYAEFSIAQAAMNEGVEVFLLKPCNEQEIEKALYKIIKNIEKRSAAIKTKKELTKQNILMALSGKGNKAGFKAITDLMGDTEQLLWVSMVINENEISAEDIFRCFQEAETPAFIFASLVLKIDHVVGGYYITASDQTDIQNIKLLQRKLSAKANAILPVNRCIFTGPEELLFHLEEECGFPERGYFIQDGEWKHIKFSEKRLNTHRKDLTDRLFQAYKLQDMNQFRAAMLEISDICDSGTILLICNRFFASLLCKEILPTERILQLYEDISEGNNLADRIEDIIDNLFPLKMQDHFVDTILQYVDKHLDNEKLSLKWIAEELVFLNEDYVGKTFIKKTGESFSSYLNKKRIERGKFLIKVMELDRIQDVAKQVGYGDNPFYFSRVFKKYTGYSPNAFKSKQSM